MNKSIFTILVLALFTISSVFATPITLNETTQTIYSPKYLLVNTTTQGGYDVNIGGSLNAGAQLCIAGSCRSSWAAFGNTSSTLTTGYIPVTTGASLLGNSVLYNSGSFVGINTTSPSSLLHIKAGNSIPLTVESTTVNSYINIVTSSGTAEISGSGAGVLYLGGSAAQPVYIRNNGYSTRLTVDVNGLVGINTTSPGTTLEINGGLSAVTNIATGTYANSGTSSILFGYIGAGGGSLNSTGAGSIVVGAVNTANIMSSGTGSFAGGSASGSSQISATNAGAFAYGITSGGALTSAGTGSVALGRVTSGNISAYNGGSLALGMSASGSIVSTGAGALAVGYTFTSGNISAAANGAIAGGYGANGNIVAAANGAIALGRTTGAGSVYSAGVGSFASGSAGGGNISSTAAGAFAQGATATSVSNIWSSSVGAFSQGYANTGNITSTGLGTFAQGYAVGNIFASSYGSFAQGMAYYGNITSLGYGALAQGYANYGNISAAGNGAVALGAADYGNIISSGQGSFVWGNNSQSSGNYSFVLGTGLTNTQNNIFEVGFGSATPTLFVNSNSVGIGTTSPQSTLDVSGSLRVTGRGSAPTSGNGLELFYYAAGDAFYIEPYNYSSSSYKKLNIQGNPTIFGAGSVGIGTTTPSGVLDLGSATGGRALSWGGTSGNYANIFAPYSASGLVLAAGFRGSTSADTYASSYGSAIRRSGIRINAFNDNGIQFFTDASSTVADGSAIIPTERMRIDTLGNVGIGTTGPSGLLHLKYDGTAKDAIMFEDTNQARIWRLGAGTGVANAFSLYNGSATVLSVSANGNVGIGTSPSYKLDVAGTLYASTYVLSPSFQYTSDARLKENVKQLDNSVMLKNILSLKPVTFEWINKSTDSKTHYGFIAQEVEKILPDAVNTNSAGYKSVEYGNLVAPLTAAVQAQQKQLDAQSQEIAELRAEIEALKAGRN